MMIIQAHDLWKTYPTKPPVEALRGFSLEVNQGEALGILGLNGAGKTTFIRTLIGLLLPDKGTISVKGLDPISQPGKVAKYLRFVPEQPFLEESWTLWQNARYWFTVWEEQWDPEKLTISFENFNLLERSKDPLNRYSRGMQQKAGLALALSSSAPIMVLDEPTLGLDILSTRETLNILHTAKSNNKTILFASHDMGFVEKLADQVALVAKGKVLEVNSVKNFRQKHGKEKVVLRYSLPGENITVKDRVFQSNNFSTRNLLKELSSQDANLIELRHEIQTLEEVVGSYLGEH